MVATGDDSGGVPQQTAAAGPTLIPPYMGLPTDPSVPDLYADAVAVQVNLSNINLIFSLSKGEPAVQVPVGVVRLSPPQAFFLVQSLRRAVLAYQEQVGVIPIPDALLQATGFDREL